MDWCPGLASASRDLSFIFCCFWAQLASERGSETPAPQEALPAPRTTGFRNLCPFTESFGSKRPCNYIGGCSPVGHSFNYSPQPLSAALRELMFCNDMGLFRLQESPGGIPGRPPSRPPPGIHTASLFLRKGVEGPLPGSHSSGTVPSALVPNLLPRAPFPPITLLSF